MVMTPLRKAKWQYGQQKWAAKDRGIEWQFTFEEWYDIWQQSGHYHERGCKRGQYVMARIGDTGPYSVNNVRIVTTESNVKEAFKCGERKHRYSAPRPLMTPLGVFDTIKAATKATGRYKTTISKYCKDPSNTEYYFI